MSDEQSKLKTSKRRFQEETAIKKQAKIAKGKNFDQKIIDQPHRLSKRHAMDCGRPGCMLCGNPRHLHKDGLTAQEHRLFQDLDSVRDKRSNGAPKDEEDLL